MEWIKSDDGRLRGFKYGTKVYTFLNSKIEEVKVVSVSGEVARIRLKVTEQSCSPERQDEFEMNVPREQVGGFRPGKEICGLEKDTVTGEGMMYLYVEDEDPGPKRKKPMRVENCRCGN